MGWGVRNRSGFTRGSPAENEKRRARVWGVWGSGCACMPTAQTKQNTLCIAKKTSLQHKYRAMNRGFKIFDKQKCVGYCKIQSKIWLIIRLEWSKKAFLS